MADTKTKNYKIVDTDTNPKYIGKNLSLQEINKYNNGRKVKTKIAKKPRDSKPPAWFMKWSSEFESKINTRFEILENNDKLIFARLEEHDKKFDKICDILERNNIK